MDINNLCPHCLNEVKNKSTVTECPFCHKNVKEISEVHHQLRSQTILAGKYLIGDVLGEGGFGITYIGFDINLEMKVAVKEFYPNGFATRESNTTTAVTIYTGRNEENVKKWRESFIKEARSLAKFSHLSGVVGVKDFFQENNTAYIIMEYLEGKTLKSYIKEKGGKVDAGALLKAIEPVMLALGQVHKEGIIHRDISPDNIMLMPGGEMKLLDFGAARNYDGDEKSLSVMLKPGYAPEEQYRSRGNQGPWSDVYAFAGTIYKAITGVTPPESMERLRKDDIKRPRELGVNLSENAENALMKALAVLAENRYQSMEEFHDALFAGEVVSDNSRINAEEHRVESINNNLSGSSNIGAKKETFIQNYSSAQNKKFNKSIIIAAAVGTAAIIGSIIIAITLTGTTKQATEKAADVQISDTQTSDDSDLDSKDDQVDKKSEESEEDKDDKDDKDEDIKEEYKDDEGIHRYEYVIADVRWKEAFEQSLLKGGYLVHLNTDEEAAYVINEIRNKGLDGKSFFVGGARKENAMEYYWLDEDGEPFGECLNKSSRYSSYWFAGEPSFKDGNQPECYMEILYKKKENKWYFNDIPNDIVALSPSTWSGKVGYIIEYDEEPSEDYEEYDDSEYLQPNSDSEYLTAWDFEGFTFDQLKLARNEIFARHGRKFRDQAIQSYFDSKSWYVQLYEPDEFDAYYEDILNDYEKENVVLIQNLEKNWE